MNIKKLLTLVGIVAILVAALPVGSAFAQGPTGVTSQMGSGGRGNWGGPQNSLVAVAAKTIGIDQTALVAELNTGKTIANVATAHGVALSKIIDAFIAPHIDRWNQAVAAGVITQAQADAFIATLKVNVMTQLNALFTPNSLGTGFVDANGDGICDVGGRQPQTMPRGRWAR
jgi:hypothetical protein